MAEMIKKCELCGKEIIVKRAYQKYCEECKKVMDKKYKEKHRNKKPKSKEHCNSRLDEILNELKEFNKLHNTNITYGKYVAYKQGKIKL